MLSNGPISFKVVIQELTAQSTMEEEFVAVALTMKESVFCSNMMLELGFKEGFGSVPLQIGNTLALHVTGSRTYSPRAKHIALRYFFLQELMEEGKTFICTMANAAVLPGCFPAGAGSSPEEVKRG